MLCHIPFILLSALDSIDSKIAGLDYGADAYIEKPFSLSHMKATINNLLQQGQQSSRLGLLGSKQFRSLALLAVFRNNTAKPGDFGKIGRASCRERV